MDDKINKNTKRKLKQIAGWSISASLLLPPVIVTGIELYKSVEFGINKKAITEYINETEKYGLKVKREAKKKDYDDIDIIMRVMDDMWNSINGYHSPQNEILSANGQPLYNKYGVGVCRNMADDVARRLNAVDEEYNAKIAVVVMGQGTSKRANIQTKRVEELPNDPEETPVKSIYRTVGSTVSRI